METVGGVEKEIKGVYEIKVMGHKREFCPYYPGWTCRKRMNLRHISIKR